MSDRDKARQEALDAARRIGDLASSLSPIWATLKIAFTHAAAELKIIARYLRNASPEEFDSFVEEIKPEKYDAKKHSERYP